METSHESSNNKVLEDYERWWVGENRWTEQFTLSDLDKATLTYYKMYIDNTEYIKKSRFV